MKKAITIALFLFPVLSFCQASSDNVQTYCLIVGTKKLLSNKVTIQVDFGDGINSWKPKESMLKDATGKPITFESMIDALNFMAGNGWNFMDAYAITVNDTNVYHWLMMKDMPRSEVEGN